MEQSRTSIMEDFPQTSIQPYVIYINGQPEWVNNYVAFGDLIEEHMGKEARDFYFDNLYDLLTFAKKGGYFKKTFEGLEEIIQPQPVTENKPKKGQKPSGKRLF